ncbi:MAG: GNAT family N-acetyltransferase [Chthoniobacterales bacterium]|nr:GNAT family N-acetyltransferase [Chthoniobacterales bacterium]
MAADNVSLMGHTPEDLRALSESREAYERRVGRALAEGVREFMIGPEVSPAFLEQLETSSETDPWRDGFGVLHLVDNVIIGLCSYGGPPGDDGAVEISYGVSPAYQGRGYATEVAQLLIERAVATAQVRVLRAHTLPESNASTRVLEKCGFKFAGEIVDPEDGLIGRWELPLAAG